MALDDADKKVFADMLKEAFAGLPSTVKGAVDTAVTPLNAKIADLEKKLAEAQAGAGAGDGKGSGAGAGDGKGKPDAGKGDDPKVAALQANLEKLTADLLAEKRQGQIAARDNAVRAELARAGTPPDMIDVALSHLDRSGQYIEKDGVFAVRGKDKFGVDVELPIADGIKAYLATPQGKHFLPAANTQGSGDSRTRTGAGTTGGRPIDDPDELLRAMSDIGLASAPPPKN